MGIPFGRYVLLKKIAAGGMGQVFLAKTDDQGFEKLVVLKRILPHLVEDEEFFTMFLDEARLAARLNHPNIAQIFDLGEDRGTHYIVMEYVAGDDVRRVGKAAHTSGHPLPLGVTLRIIADAAAGLDYAHKAKDAQGKPLGLVHRDISPQNILVGFDGGVKLIDFGVAKATGRAQATATGMLKGKFPYMSPEQAEGKELDGRSDIFALGIVLWELLTDNRLFKGENDTAAQRLVIACRVPPPSTFVKALPPELDALVLKALAKNPADRYPDAASFRLAIEDFLLSRSLPASSAHVQAFMAKAYAERIAKEADPSTLDTLNAETDAESAFDEAVARSSGGTPSSRIGRARGATTGGGRTRSPAIPLPSVEAQRRAWVIPAGIVLALAIGALGVRQAMKQAPAAEPKAVVTARVAVPVAPAKVEPTVRLCGSNTIGDELGPALVEAFLKKRGATSVERQTDDDQRITLLGVGLSPPLAISVEAKGTGTAVKAFQAKTCDVGMASRALTDAEEQTLGVDLRSAATENVVALDGIAVVVHPNNRVHRLDTNQLKDIFSGKFTDWKEVGGTKGPIKVLARDAKSGTFDTFKALVLGSTELTPKAIRFAESDALSTAVATDPTAIGFVGLAYVRSAHSVAVSEPGLDPTLPSAFTVGNESYPLSRRLYLYTLPTPSTPLVTEFINFSLSTDGQGVVRHSGFIDLSVDARPGDTCDARCPKPYAAVAKTAKRLSLDFRFRAASNDFDSRSERDLDRLVSYLHDAPNSKVVLFGFADGDKEPANLVASTEVAKEVGAELTARGIKPAVVKGFGGAMPLSKANDERGRQRNKRVEVWLQ
jgi:phosphate binding protein